MVRRAGRIVVMAIAAVVIGGVVFLLALRAGVTRPAGDPSSPPVLIEVGHGQAFSVLVGRLAEEGLISSPWAVKLFASMRGYDRRVQTGTYQFNAGEQPVEILARLMAGDVLTTDVTVPEGYNMWEIAAAFESANIDSVDMVTAIMDEAVLSERRIAAPTLEGYLFPDTYRLRWGATAQDAREMMLARLDEVFGVELFQRAVEMDMTPHEVLTLASIIEAESRVPEERARISSVYHNRLRRRMRLEADPTVAYAMGGYKGRLLYADLEIDSPYNTYRRRGLPPGPICSPGEASIRAALYPDSTADDLYFVARGDGSHIFSTTLKEHNAAVQKVRREQRLGPGK